MRETRLSGSGEAGDGGHRQRFADSRRLRAEGAGRAQTRGDLVLSLQPFTLDWQR